MISKSKTKKTTLPSESFNQAKLFVLQTNACLKIDELFDALEINLRRRGKLYMGRCPIHDGDNATALNFYPDGETVKGYWRCNTRHCEKIFKPNLLGFVRGVLSRKNNWRDPSDVSKAVSFAKVIKWLCDFTGMPFDKIEIDYEEMEKKNFTNQITSITKRPEHNGVGKLISKERVRQVLQIPAEYFVQRGYGPKVLDFFDVGFYPHHNSPFLDRVVVPIYDDVGKFALGFIGRSIYQQCVTCKHWHNPNNKCPASFEEEQKLKKWIGSKGFNIHSFLYNFWNAKKHIRETNTIVLVEGSGDVWKLWEAGTFNVCGLMSCELTDEQMVTLERSGATNVVLLLDNDEAGRAACQQIEEQLNRSYRVIIPQYNGKDIGDLSLSEASQLTQQISVIRGY